MTERELRERQPEVGSGYVEIDERTLDALCNALIRRQARIDDHFDAVGKMVEAVDEKRRKRAATKAKDDPAVD